MLLNHGSFFLQNFLKRERGDMFIWGKAILFCDMQL
jgi:hypothetical protein